MTKTAFEVLIAPNPVKLTERLIKWQEQHVGIAFDFQYAVAVASGGEDSTDLWDYSVLLSWTVVDNDWPPLAGSLRGRNGSSPDPLGVP